MSTGAPDRDGTLAKGLGLFSLALGTTQLVNPGAVNRAIGLRDDSGSRLWQRFVGIQELSAAAGILALGRPAETLWGRTAGDVMHITMVTRAARGPRRERPVRLAMTLLSLTGTFAADAYASARMTGRSTTTKDSRMQKTATITVQAPRETLEQRWREFEASDDARLGKPANPRFTSAPGDRGTEIHLVVEYDAPLGPVGEGIAKVAGNDPHQQAQDDLRRFKQLVETGEIARSDGAPGGHSAAAQPKQRPAQPLEHANA